MKLYYSTGSCSLSPHIVLQELGLPFEIIKVDLKTKTTEKGEDYTAISSKSQVPLLALDNGEKISEGAVIVQYLADLKPELGLAPKNGTFERIRLQEALNFLSSEVHKNHSPFYAPDMPQDAKTIFAGRITGAYNHLQDTLSKQPYVTGQNFTVADAYLFTILNWIGVTGLSLDKWPALVEFKKRVLARPAVQAALKAEGLLEKIAA